MAIKLSKEEIQKERNLFLMPCKDYSILIKFRFLMKIRWLGLTSMYPRISFTFCDAVGFEELLVISRAS